MMYEPDEYVGKVVKMDGLFNLYYDEAKDYTYYACIVQDATACCSQGIEFVPTGDYEDLVAGLEAGADITVVGEFTTYTEGDSKYCTLKNATIEVS
ncbi:MAG: hypothetical protein K6F30_10015 [Lachnospiraceae bacterium]|nr:hypothetical protein [Lachnospiraceae bacterium]